jgi:hypothetical protein
MMVTRNSFRSRERIRGPLPPLKIFATRSSQRNLGHKNGELITEAMAIKIADSGIEKVKFSLR